MSEPGSHRGRYLFAVGRGLDASELATLPGLRGAPIELVREGDLDAVVCTVDLTEFGEDALKRNLEDLGWVEEVARCHHDVTYAAASVGTVVPMRLVTICSDDESVRQRIRGLQTELATALSHVEGRREWSVKVYAPRAQPAEEERPRPTSGAAYLQRKREQAAARRTAGDQHVRDAEEINSALVRSVAASRLLPPQDPRLTGRSDPMILNGAYLVEAAAEDDFRRAVEGLADERPSLEIELAGPWPPYSFATLEP